MDEEDGISDADLYYAQLPGQIMRVLWDGFKGSVDDAIKSNKFSDIDYASVHYANLIDAVETLPDNQAEFWIERADAYLPTYWMVWMKWLDEYSETTPARLDG